jgi:hypothetical protein
MDRRQLLFIGVMGLQASGCHFSPGGAVDNSAALCKSDADCAIGARCTVESGVGSCKMGDRDDARDSGLAVLLVPCTSNAQCKKSDECELDQGVGFCRPHRDEDARAEHDDGQDAGEEHDECEHAQGTPLCPAQPGDDEHGDRDDDAGMPPPSGGPTACTSDADCAAGDECKHEDEHGSAAGTGTCTPRDGDHGGDGHG